MQHAAARVPVTCEQAAVHERSSAASGQCPSNCTGGCWNNKDRPNKCLSPETGFPKANKAGCEAKSGTWCAVCPSSCAGCWNNDKHPNQCLSPETGVPNVNKASCEAKSGHWCPGDKSCLPPKICSAKNRATNPQSCAACSTAATEEVCKMQPVFSAAGLPTLIEIFPAHRTLLAAFASRFDHTLTHACTCTSTCTDTSRQPSRDLQERNDHDTRHAGTPAIPRLAVAYLHGLLKRVEGYLGSKIWHT